ncbi:MAG: Activator of Hsp90 ATPase 1 family protein [Rhizobium sp.]|nr:Activator of Hsp90 ATPase 1 family protein [Rhizobium sp.]
MNRQASTRTSKFVKATALQIYRAFMDPAILVSWLPPAEMTGKIHAFDGRVGGGYRMSLFYPESETKFRGKTADREDRVDVRFLELTPPVKIVEAITFDTIDPALMGEMTMTATLETVADGTQVTLVFENLPPGVKPEDNDAGARLSLDQLARLFD